MSDLDAVLEHYGVKGMKWGVRKSGGNAKGPTKGPKKPAGSSDSRRVANLRTKPARELSNKQLKDINERLNLETNYSRLNPNKVERGRRTAQSVLATAGIAVGFYNMVNSPAGKAAMQAGRSALGKK